MKTPRVMLAAVKSGSGKTTITCALLKALTERKISPVSFKCGPDYIDPMFHKQMLHIPSRNLDSYFSEPEQLKALFLIDRKENQISIIEGVMGLYDGIAGICEEGSSYHIAGILHTPIILVVDARGMGRTILPLLAGMLAYDTKHLIKGVILNQTGKPFLTQMQPEIEKLGLKVYGCFPRQEDLKLESRHLGLILPAEVEKLEEKLVKAAHVLQENADIAAILTLAETAEDISMNSQEIEEAIFGKECQVHAARVRIALARDEAFCFYYEDNLRILKYFGAELVYFSPLHDKCLPENIAGILLPGGYPELYARELSENAEMKNAIRTAVQSKIPMLAECGGFMYLHETLICNQTEYALVGSISGHVYDTGRLGRFGYISLSEKQPYFLKPGDCMKAHEFHYYDSSQSGAACLARKPVTGRTWECILENECQFSGFPHLYYASNTDFVKHFLKCCRTYMDF